MYSGQVVRCKKIFSHQYLIVRTEPPEDEFESYGVRHQIHLFGVGFRNPANDDVTVLPEGASGDEEDGNELLGTGKNADGVDEELGMAPVTPDDERRSALLFLENGGGGQGRQNSSRY